MALYLTYDDESMQDGLGAQALRITGIYALAKQFRLRYLHTPISNAIEDIAHNLGGGTSLATIISEVNSFFDFPTDVLKTSRVKHVYVRSLSRRRLATLIIQGVLYPGSLIVHILLPMGVLDKLPHAYGHASKFLRAKNRLMLDDSSQFELLAHVRRGYDEKYANLKYARGRHLPFSYFSDSIAAACVTFNVPAASKIHIHTDLVNQTQTWKPSQEGIIDGFRQNTGKFDASEIELEAYDLASIIDCPKNFTLEIHYCDPLMKTFLEMCTAKVFIQGKSALSYLAGIVNLNKVVFPVNQSHAKLPHWYSSTDLGVEIRESLLG